MVVRSTWMSLLRSTVVCGLLLSAGCEGEVVAGDDDMESELVEGVTSELSSSVTVVEDAYVRGGSSYADRNYGRSSALSVSRGSSERVALLKFNVPASASAVSSAVLRVYANTAVSGGSVQAFAVD